MIRNARLVGEIIEVEFYYDENIVNVLRGIFGRRFDPTRKMWTVPKEQAKELVMHLDKYGFVFDDEIMAIANGSFQDRSKPIPETPPLDFETKTEPYNHQRYGINVALEHLDTYGCHGFLWEMGTGKTMAALNVAKRLKEERRVRKILVVCPASIMGNWRREIETHTDFTSSILMGTKTKRMDALSKRADVYVINYDYVHRLLEPLMKAGFDLIIADESTRIKNPDANVSKAMGKLGKVAKFKLALTGTPITQSPADAFSQFRFLNEGIFGWSFTAFRDRFCIMGGYGGYSVVGYKNLDDLRDRVARYTTRILKQQCLDLPDKVFEDIPITMTEIQKKRYDDMARMILSEIEDEMGTQHRISAKIVLTKMLRLSQICGGHLRSVDGMVHEFGSGKDDVLADLLDDLIYNGNKVIIWCRFVPEIKKLMGICDARGLNPVCIYGDVPMEDRDAIVQRFQNHPDCRVFIGQIATAGFGLNLTAASTAIYYSQDWSLEHYLQSQDRNHRIGVTGDKVTYINLYCEGSIDQAIQKALNAKKNVADEVNGDDLIKMIYGG